MYSWATVCLDSILLSCLTFLRFISRMNQKHVFKVPPAHAYLFSIWNTPELLMDHTHEMKSNPPNVAKQGVVQQCRALCVTKFEKSNGNRTSLNILRVHCTNPTPRFSEVSVASVGLLKIPQINLKSSITEVPSLPGSSTLCSNVKRFSKFSQRILGNTFNLRNNWKYHNWFFISHFSLRLSKCGKGIKWDNLLS